MKRLFTIQILFATTTFVALSTLTYRSSNILMVSAVHAIRQNLTCACGKVKLALDAKDVLRFTCYCKDCRGYYNTLNENLQGVGNALLDPWGGVDYLHVYPPEIKILTGKDQLAIEVIRPGSQVNRVYAKCCNTPLFSIGATGSALLNANLVDDANKPPTKYRIIGRDAFKKAAESAENGNNKRPSMSWSVPLSWFWTMPGRIRKDMKDPLPIDLPEKPETLKNFKRG